MSVEQEPDTGGGSLGIDFGTSAIVIAARIPGRDCCTVEFPGISRAVPSCPDTAPVQTVPTLVEYHDGKAIRLGAQVLSGGTADSPSTARWLRRYLCDMSPVQVPAGEGRMVRYDEAAGDLLVPLLARACSLYPESSLVFTIPADAPDGYGELLQRIARAAGAPSCTLAGEYEALLAGYGCSPAGDELVVVLSFTETDPDVVVLARDLHAGRLRVLARATGSCGCRAIDNAIVQDLLRKFRLLESDPRAVRLMPQIRYEAACLREELPVLGEKEIRITDTVAKKTFIAGYTMADLDRVLSGTGAVPALQECIGRALSAMRMRGGEESRIRSVLLTGAGAVLPAVKDALQSRFPGAAVCANRPLDAVARGATELATAAPPQDRITRSYALRYWDAAAQEHHYRFLVHSGTRYPSAGEVARVVISAAYDGQTLLGIPLCEIGGTAGESVPQIELVSDTGGGVRLAGPVQDAGPAGRVVHANERSPTLLPATPPARKGEPRFECTFSVDADRNLCLSARDLVTGMLVKVNAPVHRLK